MNESTKKNMLRIQKFAIGFCALATVFSVSSVTFTSNIKSKTIGTVGSLLTGLGLGMTTAGYLSNPYRKKERD